MKILFVSSEATPFAKSGGLGDAVSSLATALAKLGHDVRILIPRYYFIQKSSLRRINGLLEIDTARERHSAFVYQGKLPNSQARMYFLDCEPLYGRNGIYGYTSVQEFPDNPARFAFLSKAAFALCRNLGWIPDIMHAHDWPTSLVPVCLATIEKNTEFSKTASILTIHNLGYQGIYSRDHYPEMGLGWEYFYGAGFEYYGNMNLLKAGISTAECITTVSPTYAREIQTPTGGFGLDGLLRYRSRDLVGILNGVDTDTWNPAIDPYIPAHYTSQDRSGKAICKAALQKELGLPVDPDVPVIGMVGRLTEQKGISEVFGRTYGCMRRILDTIKVQVAVLGSGDAWCEEAIQNYSVQYANFKGVIGYSERLAHLIEAGSDFFLMPSRYEPCGLNQMYSLIYGTLPIVHRTGGLADTVVNYNQDLGDGTGFMFDDLTPQAVYDTVGWAMWAWYNRRDHIERMRDMAMNQDFSWNKSALEYVRLYEHAGSLRSAH
ncbi:MAG: glycogen synthase GlgA [Rectinemataceae bacterium]